MNYIGSKLSLLNFIQEGCHFLLKENKDDRKNIELTFCDLFAGTGIVGAYFKKLGLNIIANDYQYYSYVLNKHLIENNSSLDKTSPIIDDINQLPLVHGGFIFDNYCLSGQENNEHQRMYFSDENGIFCDTARNYIEDLFKTHNINEQEYYYLLASLLESIDKYANTASVYGAYLKKLKRKAMEKAKLKGIEIILNKFDEQKHKVYNEKAEDLIQEIQGDILYLDPPYNNRQYCDNYHILETIAKNDHPKIKGKTGLREDNIHYKSNFCYKGKAASELDNIVKNSNFKYILLSYNDEGIIPSDEIERIMSQYGQYYLKTKEYRRFKASSKEAKKRSTIEYLHCLIKN